MTHTALAGLLAVSGGISACNRAETERATELAPGPGAPSHPVTILQPAKLYSIESGRVDATGQPLRVSCETCHSLRDASALPKDAHELEDFHVGLTLSHGKLGCGSCHDPEQTTQLRLADGRGVAMSDAMQLCEQCHGPQSRDYRRGSHGGMMGYWDLSRGPRVRNNCVSCHDPHSPAYVGALPVFPPRDRNVVNPGPAAEKPAKTAVSTAADPSPIVRSP